MSGGIKPEDSFATRCRLRIAETGSSQKEAEDKAIFSQDSDLGRESLVVGGRFRRPFGGHDAAGGIGQPDRAVADRATPFVKRRRCDD